MSVALYILLVLLTSPSPQAAKTDVDCDQICRCSVLDNNICAYNQSFAATDCKCCKICNIGIDDERASTGPTQEEYDTNLKVLKPFYCQLPIFFNLRACRSGNILPTLNNTINNYEGFWEYATDIQNMSDGNVTEITNEDSPAVNMTTVNTHMNITMTSNTKSLTDELEEPANNSSSVLDVTGKNKLYFYNFRRKILLLLLIVAACLGILLYIFPQQGEFVLEMEQFEV